MSGAGPHLLLAAADDPELARQLEVALQKAELTATESARPTPGAAESIAACIAGAAESIAACIASGRRVAIVSNNYSEAVVEYLARAGLSGQVAHIEGRDASNPALMKPNPHLIEEALRVLGIGPPACVFIGDQTTDIEAGRAAGVPTIGYANKSGKVDALQSAGAGVVVTTMLDIAKAGSRLGVQMSVPEPEYLQKVGELAYRVSSLEWLVLGDLNRLSPHIPVELAVAHLAGKTTGKIATAIGTALTQITDTSTRTYLVVASDALKAVSAQRNHLLHARPATDPQGRQRLFRWTNDDGQGQNGFFISDEWLDDRLREMHDHSAALTTVRPPLS